MGKPERENRQREITKQQVMSFKKRKACILKKTMELAVLCDLQACTVIVDGDGEVTTWPEDQGEVMKVLEKYGVVPSSSSDGEGNKEMVPNVPTLMSVDDPPEWDDTVLEDLLKKPWEEILNDIGVGGGGINSDFINSDFKNIDDYQSLLEEVDTKLKSMMERIELLKSAEDYQNIQIPAPAFFLEYHQDQDCSSDNTQVPPCLFEEFLNQQYSPSNWNLDNSEDIF